MTNSKWSDWLPVFINLLLTSTLEIVIIISYFTGHPIVFLVCGILWFVSFIPLPFGFMTGIFGRAEMSRVNTMIIGVITILIASMVVFWALSTVTVTDSTKWMVQGAETVITGVIGAFAYDIISKPYRNKRDTIPECDASQTPAITTPSSGTSADIKAFRNSIAEWEELVKINDNLWELCKDNPRYIIALLANEIEKNNVQMKYMTVTAMSEDEV
nr:hypothetical protein [uncultured Methanoregula sp.]